MQNQSWAASNRVRLTRPDLKLFFLVPFGAMDLVPQLELLGYQAYRNQGSF